MPKVRYICMLKNNHVKREIIYTADGSHTIFLPEMKEHYHSVNGAITESDFVYIQKGYNFHASVLPVVFEVGFGTGLNALLTALEAEKQKRKTVYITLEKFPLENEIVKSLNYGTYISEDAQQVFNQIHQCNWDTEQQITPWFTILKMQDDINKFRYEKLVPSDVVYFDAFAPDKQPEMWNALIFKKIFSITAKNGVFVTYSAKGEVRRQLSQAGFNMQRLPGPPGKKEMLRGIKIQSND